MRTISTFYEFSLGNASSGVHVDIVKIIVSGRSPSEAEHIFQLQRPYWSGIYYSESLSHEFVIVYIT